VRQHPEALAAVAEMVAAHPQVLLVLQTLVAVAVVADIIVPH
jgi:hypothetical protein